MLYNFLNTGLGALVGATGATVASFIGMKSATQDCTEQLEQLDKITEEFDATYNEYVQSHIDIVFIVFKFGMIAMEIPAPNPKAPIISFFKSPSLRREKGSMQFATGFTLTITGAWFLWNGTKHLMNGDWDLFTILETMFGVGATSLGILLSDFHR